MNKIPPSHDSIPEPQSLTHEGDPFRRSQEEFVDDQAAPSIDKSEYDAEIGKVPEPAREQEGERPTQ